MRIGREREPGAGRRRQDRAVVPRLQRGIGKGRAENPLDQLLRQPAASAVGKLNLRMVGKRHGAAERGWIWGGIGHPATLAPSGALTSRQPAFSTLRMALRCRLRF